MHLEPTERELNEARLTAYALGELDADERADVERLLESDQSARVEVEAVRRVAGLVERELTAADDGAARLTPQQRRTVEEGMGRRGQRLATHSSHRRMWYGVGITALAAALGLAFVIPVVLNSSDGNRSEFAYSDAPEEAENVDSSAPSMEFESLRENIRSDEIRERLQTLTSGEKSGADAPSGFAAPPSPPSTLAQRGFGGGGGMPADASPRPGRRSVGQDAGVAPGNPEPEQSVNEFDRRQLDAPAEPNTESYDLITDNPFIDPAGGEEEAHSTFAIDVDTASYANVRRFINSGQLPPKDAVRIEEMINYFTYDYPAPSENSEHPFAADVEIAPAPWNPSHRLVRIGLKGREIDMANRVGTNIVFLLDVSGSMSSHDKLPLLKESMKMLIDTLTEDDRVAIVVYASASGLVLDSTYCNRKQEIVDAIDRLNAGGSTNGGHGIQLAYDVAQRNFIEGGINRVIWSTDGDLNVGVTDDAALVRMIEEKRKSGIELTVLGFGSGNLKDSKLEQVSNAGNGNYAYIDSVDEAKKVLVEQIGGTLFTIASDVKVQIEFNPRHVAEYRLIGYENRMLRREDFRDDSKDAGEIGAGHTVTALYEIVPQPVLAEAPAMPGAGGGGGGEGVEERRRESDSDLTFQEPTRPSDDPAVRDKLLELSLRYKPPGIPDASGIEFSTMVRDEGNPLESASEDFRFAAAVAAFGMILRDSPYKGDATFALVQDLAAPAADDDGGYRSQFLDLVGKTQRIVERRETD